MFKVGIDLDRHSNTHRGAQSENAACVKSEHTPPDLRQAHSDLRHLGKVLTVQASCKCTIDCVM